MLYHFSEDPGIEIFHPRQSKSFPGLPPVVWTIDREHAPHYYFPRDCPRVIYAKPEKASGEDFGSFFEHTSADKVIAVEKAWLERIRETRLYKYTFSEEPFTLFNQTAGYYISRQEVRPVKVEPMGDLLDKLLQERVELRFTPSLHPLRNRIIQSALDFSIIRFGNAAPENVP
ncbi:hypothetical protein J2Z22_002965 [Paenibacillus forsythiae]|uniref:DUF4433 domain-containing protein n=1 Tax=Paenibacillus forsythiae TaxID=365616 RepID=A0ABU3H9A1_9BACL|nr:DUF6886 family protein [Paenibacillus forsythiae]MDT3427402.1 hypothetical protein [Paenibacillus forsythiae]